MAAGLPKDLKELIAAEKSVKELRATLTTIKFERADAEVAVKRAEEELHVAETTLKQLQEDRLIADV